MGASVTRRGRTCRAIGLAGLIGLLCAVPVAAQQQPPDPPAAPEWLRDRGEGLPTSMFGTYIRKGEFLLYPFFEY
jgi:hypothetical protein